MYREYQGRPATVGRQNGLKEENNQNPSILRRQYMMWTGWYLVLHS